jgi:hypothetical protein
MFRPGRTHADRPNRNARVRRAGAAFVMWYSDFQSCESLYDAGPGLVYRLTQTRETCHSMLWQASRTHCIFICNGAKCTF